MTKKERKNLKKSLGICVDCSNKAEVGRIRCLKCLNRHNELVRKARRKNIENNKCKCGKETLNGKYRCETCSEVHKTHSKKLRKKRKENKLCIRCGKPLLERNDVTKCINCMENLINFNWI